MPQCDRKSVKLSIKTPADALVAQWAVRVLLDLEGRHLMQDFSKTNTFLYQMLGCIGLGGKIDNDTTNDAIEQLLRSQQSKLRNMEKALPEPMGQNIVHLSTLFGLNKAEQKILAFVFMIHSHRGLKAVVSTLEYIDLKTIQQSLAVILDIPKKKVKKALQRKSLLRSTELIYVRGNPFDALVKKLDPIPVLVDAMHEHFDEPMDLLSGLCRSATAAQLSPDDFQHMEADFSLLRRYLSQAASAGLKGVNILLYGPPGTGKTELARTLAADMNTQLFEVGIEDMDGEPFAPDSRMLSYRFIQQAVNRSACALVLFDEIEDIFPGASISFPTARVTTAKAWLNNVLENNPVPTIWVSNSIDAIDRAVLRRFDIIRKMDVPPKDVQRHVLREKLGRLDVSEAWIEQVLNRTEISPAVAARAAKVTSVLSAGITGGVDSTLSRVLSGTLEALGQPMPRFTTDSTNLPYDMTVLNADRDLDALVSGLHEHPSARLCLYGPPGTGKTGFANHLAQQLDIPLVCKRASDLLSKYVGESEGNIARAFKQASTEGAVLLFDEADSFLRDRESTQMSWEVSMVNELLTQMENFNGIFICSTNLMDRLDGASLRRFDLKIHFDFLESEQAWSLFTQTLKLFDKTLERNSAREFKLQLNTYHNLTPGDFNTVIRQTRFLKCGLTATTLLEGLAGESAIKRESGRGRGIGFAARI